MNDDQRISHLDLALRATVVHRRPMLLDDAPWPHARAASALVKTGKGHLVVMDDTLFLAVLGGGTLPLPSADGRSVFPHAEKRHKPDLEAAGVLADGRILLLGSGSTPRRERWFVIASDGGVAELHLPDLYAALRAAVGEGVELNVEGVLLGRTSVVLLQRGNGAGALNAELVVSRRWVDARLSGGSPGAPTVKVRRWDLGKLDQAPLTFTDGFRTGRRSFVYLAAAEDSPDTFQDGVVSGSAIGLVGPRRARWAPLVDPEGRPVVVKAEGVAPGDRADELWVTTDPDDEHVPSELLTVRLTGTRGAKLEAEVA